MVDNDDAHGGGSPASRKQAKRKSRSTAPGKFGREQSSIGFVYLDLDSAVAVAQAVLAAGGVPLSRDQLAGVMGTTTNSGTFLMKVATARTFGLLTYTAGKYELTNLGFAILDSDERTQKAARAEAFLNVPLFKRTYEEFRGRQLPPRPNGLEQAFVNFGVSSKQRAPARIAFDKSARQAGYFSAGEDRLIQPIVSAVPLVGRAAGAPEAPDTLVTTATVKDTEPGGKEFHPFVQGLLDTLPEPHTNWAIEGRAKWLQAAAHIFDLIYAGDGEIKITAKAEVATDG
jgi:hypothetical protein